MGDGFERALVADANRIVSSRWPVLTPGRLNFLVTTWMVAGCAVLSPGEAARIVYLSRD